MTQQQKIILFFFSVSVFLIAAYFQPVPGYMDAEYYYLGGRQLAIGEGFYEPVIWNYLDNPVGLPHPSHTYWMPLASIFASISMGLSGIPTFEIARISFIVIALMVPWVTAKLALQLFRNPDWAFISGLLSIASGFYLPYITTTDTFAISMVLGGVLFILLPMVFSRNSWAVLISGLLTGLFHLSRVDGFLWVPIMGFVVIQSYRYSSAKKVLSGLLFFFLGYGFIMIPWITRNLMVTGAIFSPGGNRTLWLTTYDQLFSYPADQISFKNWWESGIIEILRTRLWALRINLQRTWVEQGGIFLLPFILLGFWRLRSSTIIRIAFMAWIMIFSLMTFVFPFAGARGGLFHACAVFQPLFWALVPKGFSSFISWGERVRGWVPTQAKKVLGTGGMMMIIIFTIFVFCQRVIGPDPSNLKWEQTAKHYQIVELELINLGAALSDIVMVKNPPGFSSINRRPSIMIPNGDTTTVLKVAFRYGARYIVLESEHVVGLDELYDFPSDSPSGINYLGSVGDSHLFKVGQ